jgi:hypothetical protein
MSWRVRRLDETHADRACGGLPLDPGLARGAVLRRSDDPLRAVFEPRGPTTAAERLSSMSLSNQNPWWPNSSSGSSACRTARRLENFSARAGARLDRVAARARLPLAVVPVEVLEPRLDREVDLEQERPAADPNPSAGRPARRPATRRPATARDRRRPPTGSRATMARRPGRAPAGRRTRPRRAPRHARAQRDLRMRLCDRLRALPDDSGPYSAGDRSSGPRSVCSGLAGSQIASCH